jgi:hypothetical protein
MHIESFLVYLTKFALEALNINPSLTVVQNHNLSQTPQVS